MPLPRYKLRRTIGQWVADIDMPQGTVTVPVVHQHDIVFSTRKHCCTHRKLLSESAAGREHVAAFKNELGVVAVQKSVLAPSGDGWESQGYVGLFTFNNLRITDDQIVEFDIMDRFGEVSQARG